MQSKVHHTLQDRKHYIAKLNKTDPSNEAKALVISEKNNANYYGPKLSILSTEDPDCNYSRRPKFRNSMQPTVLMSAQQLEEEVVKQLSKDSYGVAQVPISKEVMNLLAAQQDRIKEQEKQIIEFQTQLLSVAPMSARVERSQKILDNRSTEEAHSHGRLSYNSSADAY
jgi:hypothetical protein